MTRKRKAPETAAIAGSVDPDFGAKWLIYPEESLFAAGYGPGDRVLIIPFGSRPADRRRALARYERRRARR